MKKSLFLLIICSMILAGCTTQIEQSKGPLEGFWELHNAKRTLGDSSFEWNQDDFNKMTKAYGKENVIFLYMSPVEESAGMNTMGGKGTYELKGDTLIETYELMGRKAMIGESIYFIYEVRGDTFFQSGPIGEKPPGWEAAYIEEIYLRRE